MPCAAPGASPAEVWALVQQAAADQPRLGPLLARLQLLRLSTAEAVIGHTARDKMSADLALPKLPALLAGVLGRACAVTLEQVTPLASDDAPRLVRPPLTPVDAGAQPSGHGPASTSAAATVAVDREAALANPLVEQAIKLLGATVRSVDLRRD